MKQLGINETVAAFVRAEKRAHRAREVADAALAAIEKEAEPGDTFEVGKNTYVLFDNWIGKRKVFRTVHVPRYELKLVSQKKKP